MQRLFRLMAPAVAGLIVAVAVAEVASAQGRGPRGRGFGGGGTSSLNLLNLEQVQKELELVDEQKTQIKEVAEKIREQFREAFSGLRDLNEEERRAKFTEMREKMEKQTADLRKQVDEILLPHQRDRLKQIALQVGGDAAISGDEVAKEIGLTDDQKEQLTKARDEMRSKFGEVFADFRDPDKRDAARERMTKLREEAREAVQNILTEQQKTKLKEMRGEPFELDRSQFGGFGGRGRGRGPGRDNNNDNN